MLCQKLVISEKLPDFELQVNGQTGQIKADLNTDVSLKLIGKLIANSKVQILNITATPDQVLCEGTADNAGVFECTVQFAENASTELQGCVPGLFGCAAKSNVVKVVAGEGEAGTAWGTIILIGAGILGLAYVLGKKD